MGMFNRGGGTVINLLTPEKRFELSLLEAAFGAVPVSKMPVMRRVDPYETSAPSRAAQRSYREGAGKVLHELGNPEVDWPKQFLESRPARVKDAGAAWANYIERWARKAGYVEMEEGQAADPAQQERNLAIAHVAEKAKARLPEKNPRGWADTMWDWSIAAGTTRGR